MVRQRRPRLLLWWQLCCYFVACYDCWLFKGNCKLPARLFLVVQAGNDLNGAHLSNAAHGDMASWTSNRALRSALWTALTSAHAVDLRGLPAAGS